MCCLASDEEHVPTTRSNGATAAVVPTAALSTAEAAEAVQESGLGARAAETAAKAESKASVVDVATSLPHFTEKAQKLLGYLQQNVVGSDVILRTPFGSRHLVYAGMPRSCAKCVAVFVRDRPLAV